MSYDVSTNEDGKHTVVTERRGTTFVVTINRPEVRNAIDGPTASGLGQALREFDSDDALAIDLVAGIRCDFVGRRTEWIDRSSLGWQQFLNLCAYQFVFPTRKKHTQGQSLPKQRHQYDAIDNIR